MRVSVQAMSPFPSPLAQRPSECAEPPPALLPLVAVIELKWLAAGVGQHLHVESMLHDEAYARAVIAAAEGSEHAALRRAAARLRGLLGKPAAPPAHRSAA